MDKLTVYNQDGEELDQIELNTNIFNTDIKEHVVHEVFSALRSNQRESWAHAKDRSQKSGGGRKPWRQKGTGRARHGSIRSPLWRNGGVTFGPSNEKNFKKKINKKKKKEAIRMCVVDKIEDDLFYVLDEIDISNKTQELAELLDDVIGRQDSTVFLTAGENKQLRLAGRNLPDFELQRAQDVNVMDFLNNKYVVTTTAGFDLLQNRLK